MNHTYEVEIKSLLQTQENANEFKSRLNDYFDDIQHHGSHSQLNHYFIAPDDMSALETSLLEVTDNINQEKLTKVLEDGEEHSIRSRNADGTVLLVIKASVGDDTSENGICRIEFEETVDMSIEALDEVLRAAGCEYQAKWSRDREEYEVDDVSITLDRNAGYGYLAEFEKEVESEAAAKKAEREIRDIMGDMEIEELPQDRLERMFEYYNENWREYYGTDKVFNVE